MDAWAVDEFVQRVFIKSLDEVVEEDFIQMGRLLVSLAELVRGHIEQLVLVLAGAFAVLALEHMDINYAYHSHAMGLVLVDALGKVSHIVDLY